MTELWPTMWNERAYYRWTHGINDDKFSYFAVDSGGPKPWEYRWDSVARVWVPLDGSPIEDYAIVGDTRIDRCTLSDTGAPASPWDKTRPPSGSVGLLANHADVNALDSEAEIAADQDQPQSHDEIDEVQGFEGPSRSSFDDPPQFEVIGEAYYDDHGALCVWYTADGPVPPELRGAVDAFPSRASSISDWPAYPSGSAMRRWR